MAGWWRHSGYEARRRGRRAAGAVQRRRPPGGRPHAQWRGERAPALARLPPRRLRAGAGAGRDGAAGVSTLGGVATGLQAALLLARGRPAGVGLLATEDEPALATAARSFWAAALCLPAFICLRLLDLAQEAPPPH